MLTDNLMIGQKIIGVDKNVKVKKITYRENISGYKTYNITVPGNNNYIVNGVVVHNALLKPGIQ